MSTLRAILPCIAMALCGCGGRSVEPVEAPEGASTPSDAGADVLPGFDATFTGCPGSPPLEGSDCSLTNQVGDVCSYRTSLCTCANLGQNSAVWKCGSGDADADAAPPDCTYDDGGAELDAASRFHGSCAGGCPAGTVCAVEIGGVAGGGGEYCAPIVDRCKNDVTCACLASCVCGVSFNRPEHCSDTQQKGTVLECDNGVR